MWASPLLAWVVLYTASAATPPHLTFFSELNDTYLPAFFANDTMISILGSMNSSVALAMSALSHERASAVQALNAAGVKVEAWLLFPKADGYWFNANNANISMARYEEFQTWAHAQTPPLVFTKVGLDLELDQREEAALVSGNWSEFAQYLTQDLKVRLHIVHVGRSTESYTKNHANITIGPPPDAPPVFPAVLSPPPDHPALPALDRASSRGAGPARGGRGQDPHRRIQRHKLRVPADY
jgi:hypothetical protein